jgi:hypothetical protein
MSSAKIPATIDEKKSILTSLWLFAVLNYLYCDVITHMDAEAVKNILSGTVGNLKITQAFLLKASVFMEIPIAMILFSRILKYPVIRWMNFAAGIIMTAGQTASLLTGTKIAPYYYFFSIIEISCTLIIVIYALRWTTPKP